MEEADGGGPGAAGGGRELLGAAADVPLPLLLPAEPRVQPGPRGGPLPVQGPLGSAPSGATETPGPADPAARPAGGQRAATAPSSAPHVRRPSPACAAAVSRCRRGSNTHRNEQREEKQDERNFWASGSGWTLTERVRTDFWSFSFFSEFFVISSV